MLFDRESTIVITKINNLSESALTGYCQKFGTVIRCVIKPSSQSRSKDPYALVKFVEPSSVNSILVHRNHIINGIHVFMRTYHQDASHNSGTTQNLPSLMSLAQQNPMISYSNTNSGQKSTDYEKILQENQTLRYEITNLQKSLIEAQSYSKTAYDTFQILREKFESEQALTNKLKLEYSTTVESYEARLKELMSSTSSVSSSTKTIEKDKIKDEPIENHSHLNQLSELQLIKDRFEQAQIDLGKCQTENTLLKAKFVSREQQFEMRFKELNTQYIRMKKQYEHVSSCIRDFHTKLYPKKRLKADSKDNTSPSDRKNEGKDQNSNDDIVEISMQSEPMNS